jgi:hypothetical protein
VIRVVISKRNTAWTATGIDVGRSASNASTITHSVDTSKLKSIRRGASRLAPAISIPLTGLSPLSAMDILIESSQYGSDVLVIATILRCHSSSQEASRKIVEAGNLFRSKSYAFAAVTVNCTRFAG